MVERTTGLAGGSPKSEARNPKQIPILQAQMPFGNPTCCRGDSVPKGHTSIAQRFSVGEPAPCGPSPEGTAERAVLAPRLSRRSGTRHPVRLFPTLKRWAMVISPSGIHLTRRPVAYRTRIAPTRRRFRLLLVRAFAFVSDFGLRISVLCAQLPAFLPASEPLQTPPTTTPAACDWR